MRLSRRLLALGILLVWLCAGAARAVPVYHIPGETVAPYSRNVTYTTKSPFAEDASLLQADVLDIRKGDCILLSLDGQTMLIDGGLKNRFGILEQYMQAHDMDGFDVLFLTHAHPDHVEVQAELVKAGYRVGKVISPYDGDSTDKTWRAYRALLDEAGIPWETVATGDVVGFGGATLTMYRRVGERLTVNDQSVAAMLQYGDARMFLASDTSITTQRWFLEQYGASAFACDVLKSAHHGIDSMAQTFLDALSPSACVVTNRKARTSAHTRQLQRRDIPRYYFGAGSIHLQTDGGAWLIWQNKK